MLRNILTPGAHESRVTSLSKGPQYGLTSQTRSDPQAFQTSYTVLTPPLPLGQTLKCCTVCLVKKSRPCSSLRFGQGAGAVWGATLYKVSNACDLTAAYRYMYEGWTKQGGGGLELSLSFSFLSSRELCTKKFHIHPLIFSPPPSLFMCTFLSPPPPSLVSTGWRKVPIGVQYPDRGTIPRSGYYKLHFFFTKSWKFLDNKKLIASRISTSKVVMGDRLNFIIDHRLESVDAFDAILPIIIGSQIFTE